MLQDLGGQVRVAFGGMVGLDFGACLAFAAARGGPVGLVAAVLPEVEAALLAGANGEGSEPAPE